jgi:hypothetical protein
MGGKRVIESFAVYVLCMCGEMILDCCGKITVVAVGHDRFPRVYLLDGKKSAKVIAPWILAQCHSPSVSVPAAASSGPSFNPGSATR